VVYRQAFSSPAPTRLVDISKAGEHGKTWLLGPPQQDAWLVGRLGNADIFIEDEGVDTRHALISRYPDGLAIEDLDSRTGTFVDGERIRIAPLRIGATLSFGGVVLSARGDPAPVEVEARPRDPLARRLSGELHSFDVLRPGELHSFDGGPSRLLESFRASKKTCRVTVRCPGGALVLRLERGDVVSASLAGDHLPLADGIFAFLVMTRGVVIVEDGP
jgi:hypothetical protein